MKTTKTQKRAKGRKPKVPTRRPSAALREVKKKLKSARIKKRAAARRYDLGGFQEGWFEEMTWEQLERALFGDQKQSAAKTRYDRICAASKDLAKLLYPKVADHESRQTKLVKMLIAEKEANQPGFFDDPTYPILVVYSLEKKFPEIFPKRSYMQ